MNFSIRLWHKSIKGIVNILTCTNNTNSVIVVWVLPKSFPRVLYTSGPSRTLTDSGARPMTLVQIPSPQGVSWSRPCSNFSYGSPEPKFCGRFHSLIIAAYLQLYFTLLISIPLGCRVQCTQAHCPYIVTAVALSKYAMYLI